MCGPPATGSPDAVKRWWPADDALDAVVYRPRTSPETSINYAFFALEPFTLRVVAAGRAHRCAHRAGLAARLHRRLGATVKSEQSNPITTSHPPKAFLRLVVNPILALLLRTPFAGAARRQLMVVDFTGRKSGRPYSLVLTAHLIDGILYALTGASWKVNFRDGAPAQVLHDGKTTAMRGELITDTAHWSPICMRAAPSPTASSVPNA